ncbi:unnamed protein product [Vitrella brassicaformis CCMP3155]|uniref:3-dehydroquinate synthase n=2 Tax=Vitrella brassicaformis TaxID=1169539 RepID=A0A0G4EXJ2_VITBC|nr:unnamed protein product [Vitrella brassicaformis CCMP3155]|eukprot:CEM03426.1 unnamed protein product [Vitrella brassicaformis CCMP3155]
MTSRPLELWLDARADKQIGKQSYPFNRVLYAGHTAIPELRDEDLMEMDGVLRKGINEVGKVVKIIQPEDQNEGKKLIGSVEWIVIDCDDWVQIPGENMVAASHQTPTRICAVVTDASQIQGLAFSLQLGVDALLLPPDQAMWKAALEARTTRGQGTQPTNAEASQPSAKGVASAHSGLRFARVVSVSDGGVGDRVCLDLIQNMRHGEGALVGSSAMRLAFVHAETIPAGFVPARPFRINAGPVHAYCLMGDGKSTKYLSEIQAGDEIAVVSLPAGADGSVTSRAVSVGRCKVERRPVLKVIFQIESADGTAAPSAGNVFLQQAETVRLLKRDEGTERPSGEHAFLLPGGGEGESVCWVVPVSITSLKAGDSILVRGQSVGTHLGQPIDAKVVEI